MRVLIAEDEISIAKAACVIIPISAERTMRAVLVVGLPRRRAGMISSWCW